MGSLSVSTKKITEHLNRKKWWHVPPSDPKSVRGKGKFFASSFVEAEFYGRPLDTPQEVRVSNPLIGDEVSIARKLRVKPQNANMTIRQIAANDKRWRDAALSKGYDSIVLMTPKAFAAFRTGGKIPRSLELNVLVDPRSR